MARMVQCIKLNKEAEGLDFAPLPGDLGKKIWNQVSKEAWAAWLKQQTKVTFRLQSECCTPTIDLTQCLQHILKIYFQDLLT